MAAAFLASYRNGGADDPEAYVTTVAAALSRYPSDIAHMVMSLTGDFRMTHKWPPDASEVRDACEAIDGPRRRWQERNRQAQHQLEDRNRYEKTRAEVAKMSLDEIKAKYGDRWGLAAEKEDKEAKQKRENLRHVANRRYHGDVSDNYVSPALLAWEQERASMSVVPEARVSNGETASLGQRVADLMREKAESGAN